jgi:hypothetical protein
MFTLENILKFIDKAEQCTNLLITQNLEFLKYPHSKETQSRSSPRSDSRERKKACAHKSWKKPLANANIFDALFSTGDSLFLFSLLAIYSQNAVLKNLQMLKSRALKDFQ